MIKRNCSNCNTEIELKHEKYKFYRPNLMFCSIECKYEFMNRNSKLRKKLGWDDLK